jgi:hypothetical protein
MLEMAIQKIKLGKAAGYDMISPDCVTKHYKISVEIKQDAKGLDNISNCAHF